MKKSMQSVNQKSYDNILAASGPVIGRRNFLAYAGMAAAGLVARPVWAEENSRIVSLRDAHKGTLEIDLRIMNQYRTQPQAVQDFYTKARAALTGPNPVATLAELCRSDKRVKVGGPMLGDLTATSVAVWMHLPEPLGVEVSVSPRAGGPSKKFTSEPGERFHWVRCEGLQADTGYSYVVTDSKGRRLGSGDFMTVPEDFSEESFQIAFGTCFHKVGLYRPELMQLVQERGNRAMLVLGDCAVDDRKCDYDLINVDYVLRDLSPPWQQMVANVPVFTSWDDHDYWHDDASGTETRGQSIDVEGLRQMWQTQWNNPDREVERKGIYYDTHIGPVHFIALDTRSCRIIEERGKLNSFLGEEQMNWLKQTLQESTASYILLSSGTMWTDYISAGKDSWGTWDTEGREEIFQLIDAKEDSKVILLSGDRHGARGFAIPRPGNKKIYEFEAATLGGVPGPGPFGKDRSAQLFGLRSGSWAFGEFVFKTVNDVPQATFHLINERGETLETVVV
ncbi:alkaline phosphatase D family protein [Coraliomargarita algicola]|uniref:Alkaline phosphatase D family protein n=1 Tax=Coraliomargarita algicola TaxID=3092156 RepID=A0ABZ0RK99_9BACT|nr:alkaline phosphatase D family protein [Coraliomargarita sp. J2-16]WPJ96626.1 alkaline phosphatase D family protein [Coraliomargarita sp. J2-16]